jgi:hypothetical protein
LYIPLLIRSQGLCFPTGDIINQVIGKVRITILLSRVDRKKNLRQVSIDPHLTLTFWHLGARDEDCLVLRDNVFNNNGPLGADGDVLSIFARVLNPVEGLCVGIE